MDIQERIEAVKSKLQFSPPPTLTPLEVEWIGLCFPGTSRGGHSLQSYCGLLGGQIAVMYVLNNADNIWELADWPVSDWEHRILCAPYTQARYNRRTYVEAALDIRRRWGNKAARCFIRFARRLCNWQHIPPQPSQIDALMREIIIDMQSVTAPAR